MPLSLLAGCVIAITSVAYALTYAALIFSASGLPSVDFPYLLGAALVSTAIASVAVSALSGFPFAVAGMDGNAAAILAALAASAAPAVERLPPGEALEAAIVLLVLASLVTGAALIVLGVVRAGRWIRFVPVPVIGGFLAAAGWLIVRGAVGVATGVRFDPAHLAVFADPHVERTLLALLAFTALLEIVKRRFPHPLAVPGVLLTGIALTLVGLAAARIPLDVARAHGWLFERPAAIQLLVPWTSADLGALPWRLIAASSGEIATLAFVVAVTILLTSTGLEMRTMHDVDLDRELRAQGVVHVFCAAAGGFGAFLSLSRTLLNVQLGARSRWSGVVAGVASLAFAIGGIGLIGVVPRFVVCGLLLSSGGALLAEWLVLSYRRLTRREYAIVWAILAVIVQWGFVAGLAIGVVIGCVIFVVSYSQIAVIKQEFTGRDLTSNLLRSPEETQLLSAHGERVRVLFLQGFIFFGMADRLYRDVKQRTFTEEPVPDFVLLDFRGVQGLDASAASSFLKLVHVAEQRGARVLFTRMSPEVRRGWDVGAGSTAECVEVFDSLDAALERAEGTIIERWDSRRRVYPNLLAWLIGQLDDAELAQRLVDRLVPVTLAPGEVLCRQGDQADAMFFVERGRVGVYFDGEKGTSRLRSLGAHTLFGEMGLYRDMRRSASVIAEDPTDVMVLGREQFEKIRANEPELRNAIDRIIVGVLSERLAYGNALVAALNR